MKRSLSTHAGPPSAATRVGLGPDPSARQARALLLEAVDFVVRSWEKSGVPAGGVVRRPPAAGGRTLTDLLPVIEGLDSRALLPVGGPATAAVADLLAGAVDAPALETDLLRWLADLFGLPAGSGGLLTTGASAATLSAVVAARSAMLPEDFLTGTIYVTEQTRRSVVAAARIAGFPPAAIRVVAVDANLRMDPGALRLAVLADRSWGRRPFCVVAAAGTADTGVVDPLPAIADVAAQLRLWLHVDASHGGFFQLTDRGRRRLRGIGRADSVTVDAHTDLSLPSGTGVLLVRDGTQLPDRDGTDLPDLDVHGPRPTRGLRLWLALQLHGVDAFRAALDDRLDLAAHVYAQLAADPLFDVPAAPHLSTVAFRLRHGDTAELLRRVTAEPGVILSGTRIHGRYTGRIRVLDHRTDRTRVDATVDALRRHAAALSAVASR